MKDLPVKLLLVRGIRIAPSVLPIVCDDYHLKRLRLHGEAQRALLARVLEWLPRR